MTKAIEKTKNIPLKTAEDCAMWFEKSANEVKEDANSIAQNNTRMGCVKGLLSIYKIRLDYERMVRKDGGKVHAFQKFLA